MNQLDSVPASVREQVHFDTLWARVHQLLGDYAGKRWTDTADHDPGVTLLQALCYIASDLAYRHTLPLIDLLTPAMTVQAQHPSGVFPADFGPENALTCGPVTLDDYRRALLDLHSDDPEPATNGEFYFRNVRLACATPEEQYGYIVSDGEFSFPAPETRSTAVTVAGDYHLWVELNRDVTQEIAEPALVAFLENHRNLCETVPTITWLEPAQVDINLIIELDDDCQNAPWVLAQVFTLTEALISPAAIRVSADELRGRTGETAETIYEGPKLTHGWITQLPPTLDGASPRVGNISELARQLLSIPGIHRVHRLDTGAEGVWDYHVSAQCHPQAWGKSPYSTMISQVELRKRGQRVLVTEDELKTQLNMPRAFINERPTTLEYGRHRHPGTYYSASDRIPPCYRLQEPDPDKAPVQLHQFLLLFEQLLASGCDQLALLPALLAFDRDAGRDSGLGDKFNVEVWGGKWPFPENSLATRVHAGYAKKLEKLIAGQSRNYDKELEIIDFLLTYFGTRRAPRTLLHVPPEEFLAVQRAWLRQATVLAYNRVSISIDQISALQRRIAARLGLGRELFELASVDVDGLGKDGDEFNAYTEKLRHLPFYVVEARALLPEIPDPGFNVWQKFDGAPKVDDKPPILILTLPRVLDIKRGQLIDLGFDNNSEPPIESVIVNNVSVIGPSGKQKTQIEIDLTQHVRLNYSLEHVRSAGTNLRWKNSRVWLKTLTYPLHYADRNDLKDETRARFDPVPFPAVLQLGDRISIISSLLEENFQAEVTMIDAGRGVFVAKSPSGQWPDAGNANKYQWSVNSDKDRFSFVLCIVLNRDMLGDTVADPKMVDAWIRQIVAEEVPFHISPQIHWLDRETFEQFSYAYGSWKSDGTPLGDASFQMLEFLSFGRIAVDNRTGVGFMRVVPDDATTYATLIDGSWKYLDKNRIDSSQIFYVSEDR